MDIVKLENRISIDRGQIDEAIDFVRSHLDRGKIKGKERVRAILMTEESLVRLFDNTPEGKKVNVVVFGFLGNVYVFLRAAGQEFDFFNNDVTDAAFGISLESDENSIRDLFLKSFERKLDYAHINGKNIVKITAVRSRYASLYMTLTGMILGLLAGIMMKVGLSSDICALLNNVFFTQVTTVFMNALKMVVGPVVFFSIASSLAGLRDLSETGRVGGKIVGMYLAVSVFAVGIGIGAFFLFHPGNPSLAAAVDASYSIDTSSAANVTILQTIVGIVPSNFVAPFLEANMLQIIFLAVACGIGTGAIGKYSESIQKMLNAFNELFLSITMCFIKVIPLVAFCSMASMVLAAGGEAFLSLLYICMVCILGFLVMMLVYGLLLMFSGLNPVSFYKKYFPTMVRVFAISSSNASIPMNMEACDEMFGVSSSVYSFSIPLGATVNMHGCCISLAIITLSFAQVFGVDITGGKLVGMILSIVLLSTGAPGIPGSGIVVAAVICSQFGIPVAAVSLIIGINPLLDMFITAVNCLGDVSTTVIASKTEGLLDMEVYNK